MVYSYRADFAHIFDTPMETIRVKHLLYYGNVNISAIAISFDFSYVTYNDLINSFEDTPDGYK